MIKKSVSDILLSIIIQSFVLVGVYFLCSHFQLPLSLTAATLLLLFSLGYALNGYKKAKRSKRVLSIGMVISTALLTLLFAYDHFVETINITMIHIAIILFPPLILGNHLKQKETEDR